MKIVLVSGTHGAKWSAPDTAFCRLLERHGIIVLRDGPEWSEAVDGLPSIYGDRKHGQWIAGGYGFAKDAQDRPYSDTIYLAHSYGGNCCAYGIARPDCPPIRRLITVGTPNRADMEPVWREAKKKIGFHLHICDSTVPWIERIAQLFDGRVGNARPGNQSADLVAFVPGMRHSRILDDENGMVAEWTKPRKDGALIDYLTADVVTGERLAVV